ncbi:MAG: hypothetical protein RBG13Loki_4377 [Promethearchaeota archaeon CR_4]|nr:MAG: hypothetical protein RBG13Loki_4377 [Candidatus Lokiarchaeota archaeon CR_4]
MDLNEINTIAAIASVIVDCFIIVQIFRIYNHYQYPTLRFLLVGILLLVIADLEPISKYIVLIGFGVSVIITAIDVILRCFAVFSLLLLLDASATQTLYTRRNIILGMLLVISATGVVVTALLMNVGEPNLYSGLGHIDFAPPSAFSGFGLVLLSLFLDFLILGDLLIVGQIGLIVFTLARQKKESPNPARRKNISYLQIGCCILITGSFFAPVLSFIGDTLMIFGFLFLIWNIRKSGDLLLYESTLRHLIVMRPGGIPVFSFSFQTGSPVEINASGSPIQRTHKDALYSGAISGISSLISEIIDSKQNVEQINLNRDIVIVRQLLEGKFAVLLFTGRATKLFREALDRFSREISPLLTTLSPIGNLSPEDLENTNRLITKHFGPNIQS